MVIVVHGWYRCCVKHSERTRIKLPEEASLRGRKCSGQCKGILYCLSRELAFWWCSRVSLLIMQVKQRRALSAPGWVPDTRYKWWQRSDSAVLWEAFFGVSLVQTWCSPEMTMEVIRRKTCSDICRPRATCVSLSTMETIALPNIQRELMFSFGTKLPCEGGEV
jgi:hypothetical protein